MEPQHPPAEESRDERPPLGSRLFALITSVSALIGAIAALVSAVRG
jgi:hypothetical protein